MTTLSLQIDARDSVPPRNAGSGPFDIESTSSPTQCPNCRSTVAIQANDTKRIADLEAQVQFLTIKASAAVDKLADYEDELANLATLPTSEFPRITISNPTSRRASHDLERSPLPLHAQTLAAVPEKRPTVSNRLHSFLNRRGSPTPAYGTAQGSSTLQPPSLCSNGQVSTLDMNAQLSAERHARIDAEEALASLQAELEELSASLFSHANEMVADERRQRAQEEDKANMWEEQAKALQERWKSAEEYASTWEERAKSAEVRVKDLEGRVGDGPPKNTRDKRLEALEKAVSKIDYIHGLLNDGRRGHGSGD